MTNANTNRPKATLSEEVSGLNKAPGALGAVGGTASPESGRNSGLA